MLNYIIEKTDCSDCIKIDVCEKLKERVEIEEKTKNFLKDNNSSMKAVLICPYFVYESKSKGW